MRTPLAWLNLAHQKTRTLVAVAGIAFATILIFMQFGFYGALQATATRFYDSLDFDIVLSSAQYQNFSRPGTFSRVRLALARAHKGVAAAVPLYIGVNLWRNPEPLSRRRRPIMIMGFNLSDRVFNLPEVNGARTLLQPLDSVLIDRRSRLEFGPQNSGVQTELGSTRAEIVGQFTLGTGFGADGLVIVSDETYTRIFGGQSSEHVNLGLIKVRPGSAPQAVVHALNRTLPIDVRARTRAEMSTHERRYWVERTSVGTIFYLSLLVVLIVGVVFVYQVIASDIAGRLAEYATLKAIGYAHGYLSRVVLQHALLLAALAYVPAFVATLVLYSVTRIHARIPIEMTWLRALVVLALSITMCTFSGVLALRKVRAADPADLL